MEKNSSKKEIENAKIVRKSIVAKRLIKKGERFSIKNLALKDLYWNFSNENKNY